MCLKISLNSCGHRATELYMARQTSSVQLISRLQFRSSSPGEVTLLGSTSHSGSFSLISLSFSLSVSSRYSLPRRRMWRSKDFVRSVLPRKRRLASNLALLPISRTKSSRSLADPKVPSADSFDSLEPSLLLKRRRLAGDSFRVPSISSSTSAQSHSTAAPETWNMFKRYSDIFLSSFGIICAICSVRLFENRWSSSDRG